MPALWIVAMVGAIALAQAALHPKAPLRPLPPIHTDAEEIEAELVPVCSDTWKGCDHG